MCIHRDIYEMAFGDPVAFIGGLAILVLLLGAPVLFIGLIWL